MRRKKSKKKVVSPDEIAKHFMRMWDMNDYKEFQRPVYSYYINDDKRDDADFVIQTALEGIAPQDWMAKEQNEELREKSFEIAVPMIKKRMEEEVPVMNSEDKENLMVADELSDERRHYGMRSELVEKYPSCRCVWSNAGAMWYPAHGYQLKKGEEVEIDANEMIVPFSCKKFDRIKYRVNQLPLYRLSFEAKQRGETAYGSEMTTLEWALKQLERAKKEAYQRQNR